MKSLLMGTGYKPLQSVNYYDSRAHGYERFGVLTGLVDFGMVWIGYLWMGNCSGQLWLGEVTYSLDMVVNFVISRIDVT
jgi:threonine/homoserine efflux transporter RhtA